MKHLYPIILACLVGFAAAQNAELFSDECCSKKNVGGVDYTQVPGNTTGYPACKPGCVYKRDDEPNSIFCFSPGEQPVMCTESTSSAQVVSVTRINGKLSFESAGLSHSCDMLTMVPTDNEKFMEIACTHIGSERHASETAETSETAALISSKSSTGSLEWISLHTDQEWIHCRFSQDTLCHVALSLMGLKNTLFVEGAIPIQNQDAPLNEQLSECSGYCSDTCYFWTFSYHQDHSHSLSRNHADKSECGLRSYDACCLVETNKNQWIGFKTVPFVFQGYVAVWKVFKNVSNYGCYRLCYEDPDCTTWTWEFNQNTCSLNNYIPTRKIDIGSARPIPNLYSGCFSRGFNCNAL